MSKEISLDFLLFKDLKYSFEDVICNAKAEADTFDVSIKLGGILFTFKDVFIKKDLDNPLNNPDPERYALEYVHKLMDRLFTVLEALDKSGLKIDGVLKEKTAKKVNEARDKKLTALADMFYKTADMLK